MVKVEILLSTLAAAACTASVGIAVWKLVLDRPKDSNELARRKTPRNAKDADAFTPEVCGQEEEREEGDNEGRSEIPETTPECPRAEIVPKGEPHGEWTNENLLRGTTNSGLKPDWESSSDINEWSSVADDEEDRQVLDTPKKPRKRGSSFPHHNTQRPVKWVHIGYGRYEKCT
ncbi:hypothetical protein PHYSODRAFT_325594 [Phytophthora sojae]|uniref:Uncharacterized protein n=1 Tax=Phytophthora sojae (strain P6497) TaxID=1094619 RepID=G4YWY1_PHYSP|nr:hypothetical protein PHYSODRAFT_325594 [Phytophthora sojae]EGZ24479.1 hypothetical protein PHYSODRAFT_325594 [Phytophthora sojae]|eukprot:XP_009519767.1 hypothetical protein PHYSODRAFT_325594 [Phytophthora sojae]